MISCNIVGYKCACRSRYKSFFTLCIYFFYFLFIVYLNSCLYRVLLTQRSPHQNQTLYYSVSLLRFFPLLLNSWHFKFHGKCNRFSFKRRLFIKMYSFSPNRWYELVWQMCSFFFARRLRQNLRYITQFQTYTQSKNEQNILINISIKCRSINTLPKHIHRNEGKRWHTENREVIVNSRGKFIKNEELCRQLKTHKNKYRFRCSNNLSFKKMKHALCRHTVIDNWILQFINAKPLTWFIILIHHLYWSRFFKRIVNLFRMIHSIQINTTTTSTTTSNWIKNIQKKKTISWNK